MAKLMQDDMDDSIQVNGPGSNFKFSATKIDKLGASEYTLVVKAVDESGSVSSFRSELENCLKVATESCKKSPRVDYLLDRTIAFNGSVRELHGFIPTNNIDVNNYTVAPSGCTALFDASYSGIGSALTYAKTLTDQLFNVNAVVFVITDGEDNMSKTTPAMIKKMKEDALQNEEIESILTILIGINAGACKQSLEKFAKEAGFDQYIDAGDATKENLAKLAAFVSKSISSQSQSLGTGGPSQTLTF